MFNTKAMNLKHLFGFALVVLATSCRTQNAGMCATNYGPRLGSSLSDIPFLENNKRAGLLYDKADLVLEYRGENWYERHKPAGPDGKSVFTTGPNALAQAIPGTNECGRSLAVVVLPSDWMVCTNCKTAEETALDLRDFLKTHGFRGVVPVVARYAQWFEAFPQGWPSRAEAEAKGRQERRDALNAGIHVVSTVSTNGMGTNMAVVTTEAFTRNGQTNLIRVTKVQRGMVVFRRQTFCHNGQPIAYFNFVKVHFERDIQSFTTITNSPYQLHIDYGYLHPTRIRCVWIDGTDKTSGGYFIDGWYPTNGVYYPAPDSDLECKDASGDGASEPDLATNASVQSLASIEVKSRGEGKGFGCMVTLTLTNRHDFPEWVMLSYWANEKLTANGKFLSTTNSERPLQAEEYNAGTNRLVIVKHFGMGFGTNDFKAILMPARGSVAIEDFRLWSGRKTPQFFDVGEAKDLLVNGKTPLQEWLPYAVDSSPNVNILGGNGASSSLDYKHDNTPGAKPFPAETVRFVQAVSFRHQKVFLPWGDVSIYQRRLVDRSQPSIQQLNQIANNPDLGRDKRAAAIFTSFANQARSGDWPPGSWMESLRLSRDFTDLTWLREAEVVPVKSVFGKLPIPMDFITSNSTIYRLELFPKTNAPGWTIYLELSIPPDGRELARKDVVHYLQGTLTDCHLKEFALCHTDADATEPYIEVFSVKGVRCFGQPPELDK